MATTPYHECALPVCKKPASKQCSRCKVTYYCDKEHQKNNWKDHKVFCNHVVEMTSDSQPPSIRALFEHVRKSVQNNTDEPIDPWEGLSEYDAYIQLIDAYRLRIEDDYTMGGEAGGLYAQESPLRDFKSFIKLAHSKSKLPKWWDPRKDLKTVTDLALTHPWSNIKYAVEESDIREHYNDPMKVPMLRMVAEEIYGCSPSGF